MAKRRKRATLKQVAERAGVSPTTASFVLNDVRGSAISEPTRERVLAAAAQLGYVASAAARSLVSGTTQTIALVICQSEILLVDRFVPPLLFGLDVVARELGYHVLVQGIDVVGSDDPYRELVRAHNIDGLIVLDPQRTDTALVRLVRDGFPVVALGEVVGADAYRVAGDNLGGMRRATAHLIEHGHRRIAHLPFSPLGYSGTDERLEGFRRTLEEAGLSFDPELVEAAAYSAESGALAMRRLLARERAFSAVVCGNDTIALGAMAALDEAGLAIPSDVAVVGFDDLPIAAWLRPGLTTVKTDPVGSGKLAMRVLAALMEGERPEPRLVRMPTRLVVRASSGGETGASAHRSSEGGSTSSELGS